MARVNDVLVDGVGTSGVLEWNGHWHLLWEVTRKGASLRPEGAVAVENLRGV